MQARRRLLIPTGLVAVAAACAAGCGPVGGGTGSATGMLWIDHCVEGDPYMGGSRIAPQPFDLEPTFFAGEPIGVAPHNRLIMRMQKNANSVEINDILYFDVPSSYQLARCLRGRIDPATGIPDWDIGSGNVSVPADMPWCQQMGPNGRPRIHLVPFGPVRVTLQPLSTCHMTTPGPDAVSIAAVAMDGWIEFDDFGSATDPRETAKPPEMREPIGTGFQVNYGDRLQADFDLVLDDARTQTAIYRMINVPPEPQVGGTLAGDFDFDLERGRSAQTFP